MGLLLTTNICCQSIKFPLDILTMLCIHEENFHASGCKRCPGCRFRFRSDLPPVSGWTMEPHRDVWMALVFFCYFFACVQVFLCQRICITRTDLTPSSPPHWLPLGLVTDECLIIASCLTVATAIWRETVARPVCFCSFVSAGKWSVWDRAASQNGCCVYRQLAGLCSLENVRVTPPLKKKP